MVFVHEDRLLTYVTAKKLCGVKFSIVGLIFDLDGVERDGRIRIVDTQQSAIGKVNPVSEGAQDFR